MGQAVSNFITRICGEADDPQKQNPPTPPSPPPCNSSSSSNGALKRTLSDTCIDHSYNTQACTIDEQLLLSSSPSYVSFSELRISGPSNPVVEVDVEDEKTVVSTAPPLSDLNSEDPIKENKERERSINHYSSSCQKILLVGEGERWINHYSSCQKILLVGEGDFSFSNSLAMAFGSATNMVATSLDSQEFLSRNYRKAMSNIQSLTSRGCIVMHGVDATDMANHLLLKGITFDRIVFNFPHAGCFFPSHSRQSQLSIHRILVGRFLENAKKMISEEGEIHISHKSNGFFREWNLEVLALVRGLRLIEELPFNFRDYPSYRTKYGFGGDKNFNCNPSKTYKFGLERN